MTTPNVLPVHTRARIARSRKFVLRCIALIAGSALTVALGACSASAAGADAETEAPEVGSASVATRVITDATGEEVVVPEHPERVVTLSEPTLDGALSLGITPIGTVTGRGQQSVPNYIADQASEIDILGGIAQPNFEAIGAAKPDIILVDGTSVNNNPPVIEALRQIAPVVYTGYAGGSWRDNFTITGDALNRQDEAQAVIAAYDEKVATAKASLGGYSEDTFSIVRWQGNSAALILKELLPGQALEDLGLKRPETQDRYGRGHSEPVSLENLELIDADYMFFGTLGGSSQTNPQAGGSADVTGAQSALSDAEQVSGFTLLEAYQKDQIILVDGSSWTSTGGPILMNRIIDDVVNALG